MTPLFACFPVCLTFVAIGIVAVVVVAFGMYNQTAPLNDETSADAPPSERPPLWVLPLMMLALLLLMMVLNWYWPE